MISGEYKTDLGPVIAKGPDEIWGCLNTIYSVELVGKPAELNKQSQREQNWKHFVLINSKWNSGMKGWWIKKDKKKKKPLHESLSITMN